MSAGASAFDAPHEPKPAQHAPARHPLGRPRTARQRRPPCSARARARSSRGSSSSGTRPSSGSSCSAARRSISSTRRPSVSRATGRLLVDGRPSRRPLLVQTYASTVAAERRPARAARTHLRPLPAAGTPRLRVLAAGRFADSWLAPKGAITVWTKTGGTLELVLALPRRYAGHADRAHRHRDQAHGPSSSRRADPAQLPRSRRRRLEPALQLGAAGLPRRPRSQRVAAEPSASVDQRPHRRRSRAAASVAGRRVRARARRSP